MAQDSKIKLKTDQQQLV